jgi:putative ABC transport system ATP-binding protein
MHDLVLQGLCRNFREGERVHRVLDGVEARFAAGEAVALIGRSGSGKSTLLNLIAGLDHADAGSISVGGREVSALREPELTLWRRRQVGFVHQFFNLIPTLSTAENVRLALELNGIRGAQAARRTATALEAVGLGDRAGSPIDVLSGGEQQRVAIARALIHEPSVLLADEPTGNLDSETARQVFPLLTSLVRTSGATLLLATHDRALAAGMDRVLELCDGKLMPASAVT